MAAGRILFISQYAGFIGGLEKYIWRVSNLLRERGYKTVSLFVQKAAHFESFRDGFDELVSIDDIASLKAADFDLATLHKISRHEILGRILDKFSPTVFVHDHDYFCPKGYKYYPYKRLNCKRPFSPLFCGICASLVPPRHITDGVAAMLEKNFVNQKKLCELFKSCPNFVALSDFMAREIASNSVAADRIRIIPPFIEMPPERAIPNNETPQILFAAQQVMSKGTPLFLEAVSLMKTKVRAHILGHGGRLEYFKKTASDMGLDGKVSFEGWVQNPADFFERADIGAFPSLWQEPFGLSGIEAMSYGAPVAGFDVGGVSEWLKDGLNGFLVPERDTRALADAFDRLASDRNLRTELGTRARKFVAQNFSKEKFAEEFAKLL